MHKAVLHRHAMAKRLTRAAALVAIIGASVLGPAGPAGASSGLRANKTVNWCAEVSAVTVSKIVGHTVPTPTSETIPLTLNTTTGLTALVTDCVYGSTATTALATKVVDMAYVQLNKAATLSQLDKDLINVDPSLRGKITAYKGLGVAADYLVNKSGGQVLEGMAAAKGERVVLVSIGTSKPESVVAKLAGLAVKAYL